MKIPTAPQITHEDPLTAHLPLNRIISQRALELSSHKHAFFTVSSRKPADLYRPSAVLLLLDFNHESKFIKSVVSKCGVTFVQSTADDV